MGPLSGAVAFAVGAGVATFFAPCAFPLLPGYVGYFLERGGDDSAGAAAAAAAAGSLGALVVLAGAAYAVGRRITSLLPAFEPLVGVALVAFGGATLLDRRPATVALPGRPGSVVGFGLFGGAYALAAAGCVVPVLLGVVAQALAFPAPGAAAVLAAYAIGATAPLVGVTLLASAGVDAWRSLGRYAGALERAAAVLMIVAGLGQIALSLAVLEVV
ncbi:cytochrome C biogenesis protein [Halosimplex rubrum]|uniref:Cytochrome C biogenesis protein n=1 Tax=Halosimplex rubrum TaxID=869889 RepID=A0A7D5SSZ0_9EURY|nr:cytochrome c biogenesis protein CcdA [Halosimplex rubrum]QLH80047.1 cytochrome C biogenesis protein [Halosimplex rubrum]